MWYISSIIQFWFFVNSKAGTDAWLHTPPLPIILIIPELSLKVSSLCKKNSVTNFMN
jgi:hypothetical protein